MNLSNLKSPTKPQIATLERNNWKIETLATAQVKELTKLKGIGLKTAEKIIEEAALLVNAEGLEVAEKLSLERYYLKTPPWKIVQDWEEAGLSVENIALASISGLSVLKGIDDDLATRCISAAQSIVNERKLLESRLISPLPGGGADQKENKPTLMSVRVRRAHEGGD